MTDLNDIANLVSDVAELRGWSKAWIVIGDNGKSYVMGDSFPRIEVHDLAHLERLAAGIPEPSEFPRPDRHQEWVDRE